MAALLLAFSFLGFLKGFLMFLAIVSAIILIVIVLLQEPKGGGLASAFGGMGAETFGVKTGGVNKFTSIVAGIFMLTAILYASIREEGDRSVLETVPTATTEQLPFSGGDLPIVPSSTGSGTGAGSGSGTTPGGDAAPPPGDTDTGSPDSDTPGTGG